MNQKVLVLDLTHGGEVLVKEFLDRGCSVTAVDIYRTATAGTKEALSNMGVRVLDSAPAESFDLGVVPVHCPDRFIPPATLRKRSTAHQVVGDLATFDFPVVEITGARGKTSSCYVLAHILSRMDRSVLLLTSRGLCIVKGDDATVIKDRISIAPPSVLAISKERVPADIGVLEISLGGTGLADVSVITGLGDDYPIAGGTKRAFDGKVQMARTAKVLVCSTEEKDLWSPHVPIGARIVTFGAGGDVAISFPDNLRLGSGCPLTVRWDGKERKVSLPGTYLAPSYTTAIASALAAAKALGLEMEMAIDTLASFKGVRGRGEVVKDSNGFLIRERNPGVSAPSIRWNADVLQRSYGQEDIGIVLDPVSIKICEKLDLDEVRETLSHVPAVKGLYVMNMPGLDRSSTGFLRISGPMEVRGRHKVIVQCIKEGYL